MFIHELGHYVFARIFNVKINEFAIGMGPRILSHRSKKTDIVYSIRILPFGGFVSMAGEDDESDDENAFHKKHPLKRIVISVAGATVNITVGFIVMMALVINSSTLYSTEIANFVQGEGFVSTSEQGLAVGDRITRIDGARVYTANEVQYEIMRRGVEKIDITVIRGGETVVVEDVEFPRFEEQGTLFGQRDFNFVPEAKTVGATLKHAFTRSASTIKMVLDSLVDLVTGRYGVESVSGPVGVTKALGEAAEAGASNLIYLAAFISINLGVMNLLPLPALDGGRIVFQVIELVRGKPLSVKVEGYIHFAGLALLLLLLVIVTFKDIIALF